MPPIRDRATRTNKLPAKRLGGAGSGKFPMKRGGTKGIPTTGKKIPTNKRPSSKLPLPGGKKPGKKPGKRPGSNPAGSDVGVKPKPSKDVPGLDYPLYEPWRPNWDVDDIRRALGRGSAFEPEPELEETIEEALPEVVGRVPSLASKATAEKDPRRIRMILLVLTDKRLNPVGGVPIQLRVDKELVDQATSDRRGFALLRFAAERVAGGAMPAIKAAIRLGAERAVDVTLPKDAVHMIHEMTVPETLLASLPRPSTKDFTAAVKALEDAADKVESLAETIAPPPPAVAENLAKLVERLAAASSDTTATKLVATLGATIEAATAAITAAASATSQGAQAQSLIEETLEAVNDAIEEVTEAVEDLKASIPEDSVLPYIPVAVTPEFADDLLRLTGGRDAPRNCLPPDVCTSRGPIIKWVTLYRTRMDEKGNVHRLLVRVRQEWNFVGYTTGELKRVDSRDPGSINATLDANMRANLAAGGALDLATASHLQVAAAAQLSARSTIDAVLDVVARAKLDGKLRAGIREDPVEFSGKRWYEDFGTALTDWLLPDVGADLEATLDASAHAELNINSSLLVAAKLNAAATLTNHLSATAAMWAHGSVGLSASASANINPSLSRAMNLFRFLVYENYVVTTHVEDVQAVTDLPVFKQPAPNALTFRPVDVVEYRPLFQPRLLEPRLASRFEHLRTMLAQLSGPGPMVDRLRFEIDYAPAPWGGATLDILVGNDRATVALAQNRTSTYAEIRLRTPVPLSEVPAMELTLSSVDEGRINLPWNSAFDFGHMFGARVHAIRVGSNASTKLHAVTWADGNAFRVDGSKRLSDRRIEEVKLPMPSIQLETDPLVVHINRNATYYMGVLVEAALRRPSLRFDAPQLAAIGPDHAVWKLPLLGFEGTRALVLGEPPKDMEDKIMDDEGTSTVVQLAAAGLYTEAVQGKFLIEDAAGLLHPGLATTAVPALSMAALNNPALLQALVAMTPTGALANAANVPSAAAAAGSAIAGAAGTATSGSRLGQ